MRLSVTRRGVIRVATATVGSNQPADAIGLLDASDLCAQFVKKLQRGCLKRGHENTRTPLVRTSVSFKTLLVASWLRVNDERIKYAAARRSFASVPSVHPTHTHTHTHIRPSVRPSVPSHRGFYKCERPRAWLQICGWSVSGCDSGISERAERDGVIISTGFDPELPSLDTCWPLASFES